MSAMGEAPKDVQDALSRTQIFALSQQTNLIATASAMGAQGGDDDDEISVGGSGLIMRRNHTCDNCILKKRRCGREQPACAQCAAGGAPCVYRPFRRARAPAAARIKARSKGSPNIEDVGLDVDVVEVVIRGGEVEGGVNHDGNSGSSSKKGPGRPRRRRIAAATSTSSDTSTATTTTTNTTSSTTTTTTTTTNRTDSATLTDLPSSLALPRASTLAAPEPKRNHEDTSICDSDAPKTTNLVTTLGPFNGVPDAFFARIAPQLFFVSDQYMRNCFSESPLAYNAIKAVSAVISPTSLTREAANNYYDKAVSYAGSVAVSPTPAGIIGLQILVLFAFVLDKPQDLMRLSSLAAHLAIDIGLNSDQRIAELAHSEEDRETLRSIFWTIYQFRNFQVCAVGWPLGISESIIETRLLMDPVLTTDGLQFNSATAINRDLTAQAEIDAMAAPGWSIPPLYNRGAIAYKFLIIKILSLTVRFQNKVDSGELSGAAMAQAHAQIDASLDAWYKSLPNAILHAPARLAALSTPPRTIMAWRPVFVLGLYYSAIISHNRRAFANQIMASPKLAAGSAPVLASICAANALAQTIQGILKHDTSSIVSPFMCYVIFHSALCLITALKLPTSLTETAHNASSLDSLMHVFRSSNKIWRSNVIEVRILEHIAKFPDAVSVARCFEALRFPRKLSSTGFHLGSAIFLQEEITFGSVLGLMTDQLKKERKVQEKTAEQQFQQFHQQHMALHVDCQQQQQKQHIQQQSQSLQILSLSGQLYRHQQYSSQQVHQLSHQYQPKPTFSSFEASSILAAMMPSMSPMGIQYPLLETNAISGGTSSGFNHNSMSAMTPLSLPFITPHDPLSSGRVVTATTASPSTNVVDLATGTIDTTISTTTTTMTSAVSVTSIPPDISFVSVYPFGQDTVKPSSVDLDGTLDLNTILGQFSGVSSQDLMRELYDDVKLRDGGMI